MKPGSEVPAASLPTPAPTGRLSGPRRPPRERRVGLDRRRGERRIRRIPVLVERRRHDRRDPRFRRRVHVAVDVPAPPPRARRIQSILLAPVLATEAPSLPASRYCVTVREGLVASVYSAWERAARRGDGARYRLLNGQLYRQIGSGLQPLDQLVNVEEAEHTYQAEYERAYRIIYRDYPEVRGRGEELEGEVLVR